MSEAEKKEAEMSPEVTEKATRRRFTLAYKEQILAEADQCTAAGEMVCCILGFVALASLFSLIIGAILLSSVLILGFIASLMEQIQN